MLVGGKFVDEGLVFLGGDFSWVVFEEALDAFGDHFLEEFRLEAVGDDLGVGFAFGGFHDLAGEEVEELFVSALDFGDFVGVGGDDFVNEAIDGAGVGRLEAHFFC